MRPFLRRDDGAPGSRAGFNFHLVEELAEARIDAVVHGLDDYQWLLDADRLEG